MEVPQTKRHPLPPDPGERDQLLRLPHTEDAIDPFVTDPNPVIKEKGMLALRVRDGQADCYFELGAPMPTHNRAAIQSRCYRL